MFMLAILLAQAADVAPDLSALLDQATKIVSDWKTGGALVGAIAIVNLGTNLLKVPWLRDRISVKPWVLPVASALLAGGGAFATSLHGGATMVGAISAAVVAAATIGFGGIGLHEFVNSFSASKQAERSAGAIFHDAVVKGDADAAAHVSAHYAELDGIAKLPSEKERALAFAQWAVKNPPAQAAPQP